MSPYKSIRNPLLQAALSYAAKGWRVFPLAPLSKIPLLSQSWTEIATTNGLTICEWWAACPTANVAIVAGDDLTIIDVDRKKGKDGWPLLKDRLDFGTPWVRTPSGGYHLYYRRCLAPLKGRPGVDIQRGNKYVVAPPSKLRGAWAEAEPIEYRWLNLEGHYTPLAEVPLDTVLALVDVPREASMPWSDGLPRPELLEPGPRMPVEALPSSHQEFLSRGTVSEFASRSELVHSLTARLYMLGFQDAQVLTLLWSNVYVADTALGHRQWIENKALEYLWFGCQKMRHLRHRTVEEVFRATSSSEPVNTSAEATPVTEAVERLKAAVMRIEPMENLHPILRDMAVAELGPLDRDTLITVLSDRAQARKSAINDQLKEYEKHIRKHKSSEDTSDRGPNWAHTVGEDGRPRGTYANLQILLEHKGAMVRHNLMDHRIELTVNGDKFQGEERLNNQLTLVRSWAAEYGMPLETVKEQLVMLAQQREYHPFQEFLRRTAWDGCNRVQQVIDTIKVPEHKKALRDKLVRKWLLSIVASVEGYGNRPPRGVLTFTGVQQSGKTTWLYYLVPKGMYHQGLLLRPDQRDSATKGLRYLLVELGEIGSTFRKSDLEALKAYIGQREDVYRLSYAHDESVWQRRTVFAASSNSHALLQDQTGNTRWWVLPTEGFDLDEMERRWGPDGQGYDLQQFWAEVLLMYQRGDKWDLTDRELGMLEENLDEHRDYSPIESALLDAYAWQDTPPEGGYKLPRRETDIRNDLGWGKFTPVELRTLQEALRRLTGQERTAPRRIDLATLDGVPMPSYWRNEIEDSQRPRSSKAGRWWFLPPMRGSAENVK